jgi:hypothetical protein
VRVGEEGAVIDPHKSDVLKSMFLNKKWSVGPYVGIGMGAGYGFNGKKFLGAGTKLTKFKGAGSLHK